MSVPRTIAALLLAAGTAHAQGSVSGHVTGRGEPVAGAVVYLVPLGPVAPSAAAPAVIDQRSLRFRPALAVVAPGSIVSFVNSDSLLHNVFSPGGPDGPFDLGTYATGERRDRQFTGVGTHVILCHVHPEMAAYVVVVPTSWYAVTDSTGGFDVRQVPPGGYRAVVAHRRRHQPVGSITVGASGARVPLDIALERRGPPIS